MSNLLSKFLNPEEVMIMLYLDLKCLKVIKYQSGNPLHFEYSFIEQIFEYLFCANKYLDIWLFAGGQLSAFNNSISSSVSIN